MVAFSSPGATPKCRISLTAPASSYLHGGTGADTFVFLNGDSADWVLDFSAAEGDKLQLVGFGITDFTALTPLLQDVSTDAAHKGTVFDHVDPVTYAVDEILIFGVAPADLNTGNVLLA